MTRKGLDMSRKAMLNRARVARHRALKKAGLLTTPGQRRDDLYNPETLLHGVLAGTVDRSVLVKDTIRLPLATWERVEQALAQRRSLGHDDDKMQFHIRAVEAELQRIEAENRKHLPPPPVSRPRKRVQRETAQ